MLKRKNQLSSNKPHPLGIKNRSLISQIPIKRCIPCTLHLRIRVANQLIKRLISSLAKLDAYEGEKTINSSHSNLTNWINFINKKCKIGVAVIKFNKENCADITRDFIGGELLKIFANINIPQLFPKLKNIFAKLKRKIIKKSNFVFAKFYSKRNFKK
jgi:hypothetical protein